MKATLTLIFVLFCTSLFSQKKIEVYGLSGFKFHRKPLILKKREPLWFSPPILGIGVKLNKIPLAAEFYRTTTLQIADINLPVDILSEYMEYNHLDFIYQKSIFKNFDVKLGLGYFNYWRTNIVNFDAFQEPHRHGYSLTGNINTGDLRVQLRFEMVVYPYTYRTFFEQEHWNISFLNELSFSSSNEEIKQRKINGYFLLGLRGFPVTYKNSRPSERFNLLGLSPHFGVEFLYHKYNTSLNFERDIWIRMTGGNPEKNRLGDISTSLIGLRYHWDNKGKTHKFGLSGVFIKDENLRLINPPTNERLFFYNVKGIAFSYSYPIYKNFDFELRQALSLLGDKPIRPLRFSTALIYRLRSYN